MQNKHIKCNEYFRDITKNTTKNRFGATELRILIVNLIFSSICTNQAPVFQQTCLYLRRNSATVSTLSVTGQNYGYIWYLWNW